MNQSTVLWWSSAFFLSPLEVPPEVCMGFCQMLQAAKGSIPPRLQESVSGLVSGWVWEASEKEFCFWSLFDNPELVVDLTISPNTLEVSAKRCELTVEWINKNTQRTIMVLPFNKKLMVLPFRNWKKQFFLRKKNKGKDVNRIPPLVKISGAGGTRGGWEKSRQLEVL